MQILATDHPCAGRSGCDICALLLCPFMLLQWCAVPGVPFTVDDSSSTQVILTAQAPDLAQWLLGDQSLLMCPVMPAAAELEGLQETLMLDAEAATLSKCRQQLVEATELERILTQNANVGATLQAHALMQ